MSTQAGILSGVMDKLAELPFEFGITDVELEPCLRDTLREMRINSVTDITDNSELELYVELRTERWALKRFRNSSSVNYKYSTGSEGKMVDKTMIPKEIGVIIAELDAQFKNWKSTVRIGTTGSTWTRTPVESEALKV